MRPTIHPDRPIRHSGVWAHFDGDQFLCLRVALFPDAEISRSGKNIWRDVSHALMLRQSQPRCAPCQCQQPARLADRNTSVVAEIPGRGSQSGILLARELGPVSRKVEPQWVVGLALTEGEARSEQQQSK